MSSKRRTASRSVRCRSATVSRRSASSLGGKTLTTTDITVAAGNADILGDPRQGFPSSGRPAARSVQQKTHDDARRFRRKRSRLSPDPFLSLLPAGCSILVNRPIAGTLGDPTIALRRSPTPSARRSRRSRAKSTVSCTRRNGTRETTEDAQEPRHRSSGCGRRCTRLHRESPMSRTCRSPTCRAMLPASASRLWESSTPAEGYLAEGRGPTAALSIGCRPARYRRGGNPYIGMLRTREWMRKERR